MDHLIDAIKKFCMNVCQLWRINVDCVEGGVKRLGTTCVMLELRRSAIG